MFPTQLTDNRAVAELRHFCPSLMEENGADLAVKHTDIERRMVPLNLDLQDAIRPE